MEQIGLSSLINILKTPGEFSINLGTVLEDLCSGKGEDDLLFILENYEDPGVISDALYLVSELGGKARPFIVAACRHWRQSDARNRFYIIDAMHACASDLPDVALRTCCLMSADEHDLNRFKVAQVLSLNSLESLTKIAADLAADRRTSEISQAFHSFGKRSIGNYPTTEVDHPKSNSERTFLISSVLRNRSMEALDLGLCEEEKGHLSREFRRIQS